MKNRHDLFETFYFLILGKEICLVTSLTGYNGRNTRIYLDFRTVNFGTDMCFTHESLPSIKHYVKLRELPSFIHKT